MTDKEYAKDYEAYCKLQKKDKVVPVDYEVWVKRMMKNAIAATKAAKPSVNYEIHVIKLKGDLINAKNSYYDKLAGIIWNKQKRYATWKDQKIALDECLNELRLQMQQLIDASEFE